MKTTNHTNENLDEMEAQLDVWRTNLGETMREGDKESRRTIKRSREQMNELSEKIEAAQTRLDAAKVAGGDKWEVFKDDARDIWEEIGKSFDRLKG